MGPSKRWWFNQEGVQNFLYTGFELLLRKSRLELDRKAPQGSLPVTDSIALVVSHGDFLWS